MAQDTSHLVHLQLKIIRCAAFGLRNNCKWRRPEVNLKNQSFTLFNANLAQLDHSDFNP